MTTQTYVLTNDLTYVCLFGYINLKNHHKYLNLTIPFILQAGQCPLPSVIKITIAVSNLLVAVNSTSNFFIYIWKGVQFRRQLQNKLTRRQASQYYNGPFRRTATTRATTRVTDMMEMNSIPQCCD